MFICYTFTCWGWYSTWFSYNLKVVYLPRSSCEGRWKPASLAFTQMKGKNIDVFLSNVSPHNNQFFWYTENRDHWWRWGRCHWNDAFRHGADAEPFGVQGKWQNTKMFSFLVLCCCMFITIIIFNLVKKIYIVILPTRVSKYHAFYVQNKYCKFLFTIKGRLKIFYIF